MEHLKANIEALGLALTEEDVAEVESGYQFDLGFPHNFLTTAGRAPTGPQDIVTISALGHFDYVAPPVAVKPHLSKDLSAPWKP